MSEDGKTHPDAIRILQDFNFGEENAPTKIAIMSLYHEADTVYLQRLEAHLEVRRRQLAINEQIETSYHSCEMWGNFPTENAHAALLQATYLLILFSVEFLHALYEDKPLYACLQQAIRNKGATISIGLMTTKVAWSRDEFPVSNQYPFVENKALSMIRDKDEVYVEIVEQIAKWIINKRQYRREQP